MPLHQCHICSKESEKKFLCKVNLIYGSSYDLVQCEECTCIYFSPLPTNNDLGIFYSGSYFNFSRWHDEAKGGIYAKRLAKIKDHGNFLDVGSALGYFIRGIKQNSNWNVFGVEFGTDAVEFAKNKLGLNIKQGELTDAGFPDKFFDYIHINNVLEHVKEPKTLLTECKRILKDDGFLYLAVPNGFNDCQNLIRFYNFYKLPAKSISGHIYFFPKQSLLKLLSDLNFEILSKKSGSVKRGFRNVGLLPKKKNWEKGYYPDLFPAEIKENKLVVDQAKKYPDIYYKYRYLQSYLHEFPGLYSFALDFIFLVRPKGYK